MASLESALEEERQQIMALLEGNAAPVKRTNMLPGERAKSPASTRSPVRSMLDVGEKPQIVRSMLDVSDAPLEPNRSPALSPTTSTSSTSPVPKPARIASQSPSTSRQQPFHTRSVSDASSNPPYFAANDYSGYDKPPQRQSYGGSLGVSPGYFANSRRRSQIPNSMATVIRAADEDGNPITIPVDYPKASESTSKSTRQSMSPAGRLGRSQSPGGSLLPARPQLAIGSRTMMTDSGQLVDMDSAWRRLSNTRDRDRIGLTMSKNARNEYGETVSPSGGVRLAKDYPEGEFDEALHSSDESVDSGIDSGTEFDTQRGRRMTRPGKPGSGGDGAAGGMFSTISMGRKDTGPRESRSLLASLEDERIKVAQTQPAYKVKSLLEPPTDPASSKRPGVHPSTNFGSGSGISTPMDSDEEAELRDIKRAQKLDLALSPIMSTPESHRAIRTITRGDFKKTQQEVEKGSLRERMYLVATDLSDEAMYALEWTIGTVLRDGDTLLCVYAIDEEGGVNTSGLSIGDGSLAVKDHDEVLGKLEHKPTHSASVYVSPLNPAVRGRLAGGSDSATSSPDGRVKSKDEQDRYRATEDITQKCVRLLRKTKLQVKVVVEVFHCKSPRHLICEVIDFMEPTLVVLGSRGRSALKGVLLGSFSNYLVMKSSVPVMVARRKLRKPSKTKRPLTAPLGVNNSGGLHVRLSNNLTGLAQGMPKSKLDYAIIDK